MPQHYEGTCKGFFSTVFFQCLKIKSPYIVTVLNFTAVKNNFPYTQKLMSLLGLDILAD